MLTALLALAVVTVSLAVIVYLSAALFGAFNFPLRAWWERGRLDRYAARARRGDRWLATGAVDRALADFQSALYPYPATTPELAAAVAHHHTGVLSRLIAAADRLQGGTVRLLSLAKVDRLLSEHAALQRRYLTTRQSGGSERVRAAEADLRENIDELRAALDALTAEILATASTTRYH